MTCPACFSNPHTWQLCVRCHHCLLCHRAINNHCPADPTGRFTMTAAARLHERRAFLAGLCAQLAPTREQPENLNRPLLEPVDTRRLGMGERLREGFQLLGDD